MIEAELKARLHDPRTVCARLRDRAAEQAATYRDTYYDHPDHRMDAQGRELRVRVVETGGSVRTLLTYKQPPVDTASQSKPEHETGVADAAVMGTVFAGLGLVPLVELTEQCRNYRFTERGREMPATVVTVPELDDTFIEVETMADESDTAATLDIVRAVLADLGVTEDDLTTERYTDAVRRARA